MPATCMAYLGISIRRFVRDGSLRVDLTEMPEFEDVTFRRLMAEQRTILLDSQAVYRLEL